MSDVSDGPSEPSSPSKNGNASHPTTIPEEVSMNSLLNSLMSSRVWHG
jgi:hypothetical protein